MKEHKGNKKDGSIYLSIKQLAEKFFYSRFNRDNMHDPAPGEDIDNSKLYRIYNKADIVELIELFMQYFEWAINAENISRVYLTDNIMLRRDSTYPKIKLATPVDANRLSKLCKAGEYYITRGRYNWTMWLDGDAYQKMIELKLADPEFNRIIKELTPELEVKNAERRNKDKSS